jgi:peroxiredoxin (alkyl hydroperoxide reductase subunit C)
MDVKNLITQEINMTNVLIGKPAPVFTANAAIKDKIVNGFSLESFLGKYVFFFFYPLDFTFVCPTELHAFQEYAEEFAKRNAQIIGCSIDSPYSHHAWLNTPKSKGGIEGVEYPLVSDINKSIARDYQVLEESAGIAYRGQFLIDKQGIVRHMLVNDLPIGRSVEEVLRLLDALIFHETHGEVCPANWKIGERSMKPNSEGLASYFA